MMDTDLLPCGRAGRQSTNAPETGHNSNPKRTTTTSQHRWLRCLLIMLSVLVIADKASAGTFIFAENNGANIIAHPAGYVGNSNQHLVIGVCVDQATPNAVNMETAVQNTINTWNGLQVTTGNLVTAGAPSNSEIDFESVLLHELGHCIGLAHVNLASESGLPGASANATKSTRGADGSYDTDPGQDGIYGSADDLRGDDVNLYWFNPFNDPFQTPLIEPVDNSNYSRDLLDLPGGDSFPANADRAVADLSGYPNTEAVMQQGSFAGEAQRTLAADDASTIMLAMSGTDRTANSADDYTFELRYIGRRPNPGNNSECDITIAMDTPDSFAFCSVGGSWIAADHIRITSAGIHFSNQFNWYFNPISNGSSNTAPVVNISAPADNSSVVQGTSIGFAASASDAEDGNLGASLSWNSSLDGSIGSGTSFSTSALSVGTHSITASVTDSGNLDGFDAISVTVNPSGGGTCSLLETFDSGASGWTNSGNCSTGRFIVATPTQQSGSGVITQPNGDHTSGSGNALFSATNTSLGSNDVDNGNCIVESPRYSVTQNSQLNLWYFHGQRDAGDDPSGDFFRLELSTNNGASWSSLAQHGDVSVKAEWTKVSVAIPAGADVRIRVQASDGSGAGDIVEAGIDDISICSGAGGTNTAPVVNIGAPADNASVVQGTSIGFAASASDAEDGNLGASLSWNSSLDGSIGSGTSFSTSALSVGTHSITASVTDSGNLDGFDAISVTVNPSGGGTCSLLETFDSGASGWTNSGNCSTGRFIVATPTQQSGSGVITQPNGDHTSGSGNALFSATNTSLGSNDVDNGNCIVESPRYSVTQNSQLNLWYFHGQRDAGDDPSGDFFRLELSTNNGASWSSLAQHGDVSVKAEWTKVSVAIPAGADVRIRVQASDGSGAGDIVEAGIDDISICR